MPRPKGEGEPPIPSPDSSFQDDKLAAGLAPFSKPLPGAAMGGRPDFPELPRRPTPIGARYEGPSMNDGARTNFSASMKQRPTPVTFTAGSSMTLQPSPSSQPYASPPVVPQKRSHGASSASNARAPGFASLHDAALALGAWPRPPSTRPAPLPAPTLSAAVHGPQPSFQGGRGDGGAHAGSAVPAVTPFRDSRLNAMERRIRALNEENFQLWRANEELQKELVNERALRLGGGMA